VRRRAKTHHHNRVFFSRVIDPWVIVVGLFAPSLFWIGYLYYKDRIRPEPFAPIGLAYLLGIGSGMLGLLAYDVAEWLGMPEAYVLSETNRPWFFVYVVGFVGVIEEVIKSLPFFLVVLRFKAFDEVIDGIVYASVIALGYASYENLLYLPYLDGPERWGRAFASPLVHTMFASIWGYTVANARMRGRPIWRPALVGLAIAAAVHGVYDFIATDPILAPFAAAAIGAVWFWRMWLIRRLQREQQAQLDHLGRAAGAGDEKILRRAVDPGQPRSKPR
jgi:RsiW-degrading membrane proteinase PrsW (M82 family)